MTLTFLGTGTSSGVPVLTCHCSVCQSLDFRDQRMRTSMLVEVDNQTIVIDSGPDFRLQMLRSKVRKLDAIIYTHEHKDHTAGLDDIRPFNYLNGNKPVSIYGHQRVLEQLKTEFHYAFAEQKYPGVPVIDLQVIENKTFEIGVTKILPIDLLHHKLQVFGYRFGDFSYVTDANYISEIEKEKLKNSKVLVLNALQITKHISHFNLEEAIELAVELNAERTYFTHISHKLGLHKEISLKLPPNIFLAYDGLKIRI